MIRREPFRGPVEPGRSIVLGVEMGEAGQAATLRPWQTGPARTVPGPVRDLVAEQFG